MAGPGGVVGHMLKLWEKDLSGIGWAGAPSTHQQMFTAGCARSHAWQLGVAQDLHTWLGSTPGHKGKWPQRESHGRAAELPTPTARLLAFGLWVMNPDGSSRPLN